jgi:hypothetical protein
MQVHARGGYDVCLSALLLHLCPWVGRSCSHRTLVRTVGIGTLDSMPWTARRRFVYPLQPWTARGQEQRAPCFCKLFAKQQRGHPPMTTSETRLAQPQHTQRWWSRERVALRAIHPDPPVPPHLPPLFGLGVPCGVLHAPCSCSMRHAPCVPSPQFACHLTVTISEP